MARSDSKKISLQPRDMFTPIATLSGLLIASVGILHTSVILGSVIKSLTGIILLMLLFLITTAILAGIYSFNGKEKYWQYALLFFPISWGVFGIGIAIMLFVVVLGVTRFPVVNLSPVEIMLIGGLVVTFFTAIAAYIQERGLNKKRVIEAKRSLDADLLKKESNKESSSGRDIDDLKMDFIGTFIEIESVLRRIAGKNLGNEDVSRTPLLKLSESLFNKNLLDRDLIPTFDFIRQVRNGIVHGQSLPHSIVAEALTMSRVLLSELRRDNDDAAS